MKCSEIQKYIKPYAEDELEMMDMINLVEHIQRCKDCYEELEIYYILIHGLKEIENDEKFGAFNIKKELDDRIKYSKKVIRVYKSFRNYCKSVFVVASICLLVVLIYFILINMVLI